MYYNLQAAAYVKVTSKIYQQTTFQLENYKLQAKMNRLQLTNYKLKFQTKASTYKFQAKITN